MGRFGGENVLVRVFLKIWIGGTAWEVKERGDLGEGNFMMRGLFQRDLLKRGLLGVVLAGNFLMGVVEVGIVLGAIVV